ncbi:hypothetical protein R0I52_02580 [Psychrobacter sp. CAM01]|uniref:hypothetical protein n=1 Tax=Psychrobacter sp. CAM01 TaxID=3080335 RepID=UPI002935C873|nr:hypothetical protein [Psychrobacter sp. CAM01]MDV2859591.1 hypothetical protein [Psychrobacter sp. CAM01]
MSVIIITFIIAVVSVIKALKWRLILGAWLPDLIYLPLSIDIGIMVTIDHDFIFIQRRQTTYLMNLSFLALYIFSFINQRAGFRDTDAGYYSLIRGLAEVYPARSQQCTTVSKA